MTERLNALNANWSQFTEDQRKTILTEAQAWITEHTDSDVILLTKILLARDVMRSNLLAALALLDEARSLIASNPTSKWLPEIMQLRASIYQMQGHRQEAFDLLVKAYTSSQAADNPALLAKISLHLGIIAANSGDYDGASVYLTRSLEYSKVVDVEPGQVAQTHLVLAQAHLERGAHDDALHHAEKALQGYAVLGSGNVNSAAALLTSIHLDRKDLGKARSALSQIVTASITPFQEISFLNLRAKLLSLEGSFQDAMEQHDRAVALAIKIGNHRLTINSIQLKCETYLAAGQHKEALGLLGTIDTDVKSGYDLLSLHELKAKAFEGIGDYHQALDEQKKFSALQKDLLSQRASNALSRLRAAQEVLQAEREAAHFRERSQFYAKELSQRTSYLVQQNEYVNRVIDHLQELTRQRPEISDVLKDIRKRLRELPGASFDWNEYIRLFDEIHPNALVILQQQYPDLSPTESKICSLVLAKLSNIDIARLLGTSERTVENHRHRLRKKLGLEAGVDLTAFLERTLAGNPDHQPATVLPPTVH